MVEIVGEREYGSQRVTIVNQLARIVNKSPFYNSTEPFHPTFV